LCGFIDQMNLSMRPPIKVANNSSVRLDTIVYGPNALWLTGDSVNNVQEHQSSGQHLSNFQSAFGALISRFKDAMGEASQGVSNLDPFKTDKTATEVKDTAMQRQSRDQYNQLYLEESLKDEMMMWLSNNQQFLFDDPSKHSMVLNIIGKQAIQEYKQLGIDQYELTDEAITGMAEMVDANNGVTDSEIQMMGQELQVPRNPVIMNPNEKNPANYEIKPKMSISDDGGLAELIVTPDDLEGVYNYHPDVQSMSISAGLEQNQAMTKALDLLINPAVQQMLAQTGIAPKIKDILVDVFERGGVLNADRLFEESKQPMAPPQGPPADGSMPPAGAPNPVMGGAPMGPMPQI
jgi:hypothetical protein